MKGILSGMLILVLALNGCSLFSTSNLDKAKGTLDSMVVAGDEMATVTRQYVDFYAPPPGVTQAQEDKIREDINIYQQGSTIYKFLMGLIPSTPETPIAPQ